MAMGRAVEEIRLKFFVEYLSRRVAPKKGDKDMAWCTCKEQKSNGSKGDNGSFIAFLPSLSSVP